MPLTPSRHPHPYELGLELQLQDGVVVRLGDLIVQASYAGQLEGKPDAAGLEKRSARFRESIRKLWGERATLELPPPLIDGWLPPMRLAAWFTCPEPIGQGEGDCGSELVVLWCQFPEETHGRIDVPDFVVRAIDWRAQARNFDL